MQLHIATRKKRRKLAGEQVCVRACDVKVDVIAKRESVDGAFEVPDVLDLVQEDIVCAGTKALHEVAVQPSRLGGILFVKALEVDVMDVRVWDPL